MERPAIPRDDEAERAVLSAMLLDPPVISEVVQVLRKEHFYVDAHQRLFGLMIGLWDEGKPVDKFTLGAKLMTATRDTGQLEDVGGYGGIADIVDVVTTAMNVMTHVDIVLEKWKLRRLICIGSEMVKAAYQASGQATEIGGAAETELQEVGRCDTESYSVSFEDALPVFIAEIDDRCVQRAEGKDCSGIKTGFLDIDEPFGGFRPNEMTVLGARPSVGKTALALAFAFNAAKRGTPVGFFTLEQTRLELISRLACAYAGIDSIRLRDGKITQEEAAALVEFDREYRRTPIHICDRFSQSMLQISAQTRTWQRKQGIQAVFIDYMQLITAHDRRQPRQEQVAGMSRAIKQLSRELKIAVCALAQVNRKSTERTDRAPQLSDLRESGSIEQDADNVMLLHRLEPERHEGLPPPPSDEIELIIAKARNGNTPTCSLIFAKRYMRFENAGKSWDR